MGANEMGLATTREYKSLRMRYVGKRNISFTHVAYTDRPPWGTNIMGYGTGNIF